MSDVNEEHTQRVAKAFEATLNRHGYGFQYSVLKQVNDLWHEGISIWIRQVAEFPVEAQGNGTRIDFILERSSGNQSSLIHGTNTNFYLLAECKRANPALSNWCFARAPFVNRNRLPLERYWLEHVKRDKSGVLQANAEPRSFADRDRVFHIALEVKAGEQGDAGGQGRGAIEEAATQVCRGLNGMVEFLAANTRILAEQNDVYMLPVIFTTAKIWSSEIDLASADIETGKVNFSEAAFKEQSWIVYQYHQSPGIKHTLPQLNAMDELGDWMDSQYVRSIPIVSPSGIREFLLSVGGLDL